MIWGIAFFMPQFAGYLKELTGQLDFAFYLWAGLLLAAVVVSRFLSRPLKPGDNRKHSLCSFPNSVHVRGRAEFRCGALVSRERH
jgi:nitrate/nitrite transporter NarK